MYAIIESGSKQFKVQEGDIINVELLKLEEGSKLTIDNVLLVSNGDDLKIGEPFVKGASVETTVIEHGKNKKVIVMKYRRKTRIRKKNGHRQPFTQLKIEKINA